MLRLEGLPCALLCSVNYTCYS